MPTDDEERIAREVADYLSSQVHLTSSRLGTVTYRPHPLRADRVRVTVQRIYPAPNDGAPAAMFLIEEREYDVAIVAALRSRTTPRPT